MIIHPDHARSLRQIGTIAGRPVYAATLDSANRPDLPRSPLALNGSTTWLRIGAGPWTRADRVELRRLAAWLDPGTVVPWTVGDLTDILMACGLPEVIESDRAGEWIILPDPARGLEHYQRAHWNAAERYAAAVLTTGDTP